MPLLEGTSLLPGVSSREGGRACLPARPRERAHGLGSPPSASRVGFVGRCRGLGLRRAGLGAAVLLVPSTLTCLNPLGRVATRAPESLLFLSISWFSMCRAARCEGASFWGDDARFVKTGWLGRGPS